MSREPDNQREDFADAKREYKAGLEGAAPDSRFTRRRSGLGGSGDRQLNAQALWRVRETARHMAANDSLPGSVTQRLVDHIIGTGFKLEPMTGDNALDTDMLGGFKDWGEDASRCDYYGERTFAMQETQTAYQQFMDGDIFSLLLGDGTMQVLEGDLCVTPWGESDYFEESAGIVNGIQLNAGRPTGCYFAKSHPRSPGCSKEDAELYPFHDDNGIRQLLQMYRSDRVTGHRGVSSWHPVMVDAGMLDDLDFSMLVKAQNAAIISGVIETGSGGVTNGVNLGPETKSTNAKGQTETTVSEKAGTFLELPKGKTLNAYAPNIPNPDHMNHVKQQLKKMGQAMHMPFMLLLLDASEGNFSAHRAVIGAVHKTWIRIQRDRMHQFNAPVYRWWAMRQLPSMGAVARRLAAKGKYLRHKWIAQRFPSIKPLEDATTDRLILESNLDSPQGVASRRGLDYDDVIAETVKANKDMIQAAMKAAKELKALDESQTVDWRDVVNLPHGQGTVVNLSGDLDTNETKESANATS